MKIKNPLIYGDAFLRVYGNSALIPFLHKDSLGEAGEGLESMVNNLEHNNEIDNDLEDRNQFILLSAQNASSFKDYKNRINSPPEYENLNKLNKPLKIVNGTLRTAGVFTFPIGF